jgi:hypothetical protein
MLTHRASRDGRTVSPVKGDRVRSFAGASMAAEMLERERPR